MYTEDQFIIVSARITMKTTEEGGRKHGFKSGYRPNHVFVLPEDLKKLTAYMGAIEFSDQELIEAGESKVVTVKFVKTPDIDKYISIGQKWFINEGPKTLGFGEIINIL